MHIINQKRNLFFFFLKINFQTLILNCNNIRPLFRFIVNSLYFLFWPTFAPIFQQFFLNSHLVKFFFLLLYRINPTNRTNIKMSRVIFLSKNLFNRIILFICDMFHTLFSLIFLFYILHNLIELKLLPLNEFFLITL